MKKIGSYSIGDFFKLATETLFAQWIVNEETVTITDVEYLSGYYIYYMGANSVVHFHVQECPGWKFGIWWSEPEGTSKWFKGEFFAQFEKTIDKFKPSRSIFQRDFTCCLDDDYIVLSGHNGVYAMVNYIRNEPYLAFVRDRYGYDYNSKYVSKEEAENLYREWEVWYNNKVEYTKRNNSMVMEFVEKKIIPYFSGSYIVDNGVYCSPRYSLLAPYKLNKQLVDGPGLFEWFDESDEQEAVLKKEWDSLIKTCQDISDKYSFFWSQPIHDFINFYGLTGNEKIECLDIPLSIYNILASANIKTVQDVIDLYKKDELKLIRGIGPKRLEQIKTKLLELGADME